MKVFTGLFHLNIGVSSIYVLGHEQYEGMKMCGGLQDSLRDLQKAVTDGTWQDIAQKTHQVITDFQECHVALDSNERTVTCNNVLNAANRMSFLTGVKPGILLKCIVS